MNLCLGLSPSPSSAAARVHAPALEALLRRGVPEVTVVVADSYQGLGSDLLAGRMQMAWAPPIVCARVELSGGCVRLRAVRAGETSYRAGLVCRIDEARGLAESRELVAAWVDEDSAAGYLLARSWLAGRHIDAVHGFKSASFLGSYIACLEAVAAGAADVTSVFVSSARALPRTALDEVPADMHGKLRVFAFTGETQTDGVITAPHVHDDVTRPLIDALAALHRESDGVTVMKKLFGCDELRATESRATTSTPLRDLIAALPHAAGGGGAKDRGR
jgi:phosphonate transport system substrate-binding protein